MSCFCDEKVLTRTGQTSAKVTRNENENCETTTATFHLVNAQNPSELAGIQRACQLNFDK
eukprot:CAMPEP_0202832596 /NCGR_PEP_ID=MMETSP1389-20130828/19880_1 /ASSEMBLY_ACC=CAM_ASM_000865 /TAXON_ID=302021 /ORGANISM="Rhodomonas sp., Strain CCMP768" /LENGTH=59 /DNA_ID=CAMNT_0049506661 /DNA_START=65 /DNA_END=241 /DNA_ORIENTATION=-